ncbi:hypothetical protein V7S76_05875 [Aquirufa sp. ROCK2-A2]
MKKAQALWFLLNKIDRKNTVLLRELDLDKDKYPFFYLLNWNEKYHDSILKKVALQSMDRTNYYFSIVDATEYSPYTNYLKMDNLKSSNNSQNDIINNFLQNLPSISKSKKSPDVYQEEITDDILINDLANSLPISETFASILIKQEKFDLAIRIYEELSLIKPEKSLYFATQILELKNKLTK